MLPLLRRVSTASMRAPGAREAGLGIPVQSPGRGLRLPEPGAPRCGSRLSSGESVGRERIGDSRETEPVEVAHVRGRDLAHAVVGQRGREPSVEDTASCEPGRAP
jgi:hypothetical protein